VVDAAGAEHNWRAELLEALRLRRQADGSWVNPADRWHEGNPVLVTAYAVLALQEMLR
jgi:squalene-hopene/tetraprenyl-beta-curcumene cyclase